MVMTGRKAYRYKSNMALVRDKCMFCCSGEQNSYSIWQASFFKWRYCFDLMNVFCLSTSCFASWYECSFPLLEFDSVYIHEHCYYWEWNLTTYQLKEKVLLLKVCCWTSNKRIPLKCSCELCVLAILLSHWVQQGTWITTNEIKC